jgi:hypothetical protein
MEYRFIISLLHLGRLYSDNSLIKPRNRFRMRCKTIYLMYLIFFVLNSWIVLCARYWWVNKTIISSSFKLLVYIRKVFWEVHKMMLSNFSLYLLLDIEKFFCHRIRSVHHLYQNQPIIFILWISSGNFRFFELHTRIIIRLFKRITIKTKNYC